MLKYKRKTEYIEAVELKEPVYGKKGKKLADKRDFLVIEGNKQLYYKREDFFKEFTLDTEPITVPYVVPCPCPVPIDTRPYPWSPTSPWITWDSPNIGDYPGYPVVIITSTDSAGLVMRN